MIQCVDDSGKPISGLFRNDIGALVVADPNAYHKYITERNVILSKDKKIAELEDKINRLALAVEFLQQNKV